MPTRKALMTVLLVVAVSFIIVTPVVYTAYQEAVTSRHVIYSAGTKLYGVDTQVVSAYNLIVNIS